MSSNTVSRPSLLFYSRQEQQPTPTPSQFAGWDFLQILPGAFPVQASNSAKQSSGEALGWEWVCTGGEAEHPRVCVNTGWDMQGAGSRASPGTAGLAGDIPAHLWRHRHRCLTNRSTLGSSCCQPTARLCPGTCPVPTCSTRVCWTGCHHITAFPTAKCNPTGPGGFGRLLEHHPYNTFPHSREFYMCIPAICFNFSRTGLPGQQSCFRCNLLLHLFLSFHELQMQKLISQKWIPTEWKTNFNLWIFFIILLLFCY